MSQSPHLDHPWGPVKDALESTVGRVGMLFLVAAVGMGLGAAIAFKSISGVYYGVVDSPWILFTSIISGYGLIVIPASLIYGYLFTVYEWSKLTLGLLLLSYVFLSYNTTDYILHRSPAAKVQSLIDDALNNTKKQ